MSDRTFYASTYVVADGVTRTWPFSFAGVNTGQESGVTPYLYPEDVKVQEIYTDAAGNRQTVQRTGVLNAPNQITIDGPAIIAGREIRIYRETELRFPLVDYRDLQSVSEHDLDLANRQAVFIAQETRDTASANLVYDKQGHFNAGGRRIVNMAPGIDLKDAVNVQQFRQTVRTPTDEALIELPNAESRKGKVLTFDPVSGQPVVQFPSTSSSLELEMRLRSVDDLMKGVNLVGRATVAVGCIHSLLQHPQRTDVLANVTSYYAGWFATLMGPYGGDMFAWDAERPKTAHNGGSVHSPTVPWDGGSGSHADYLAGVGETAPTGKGCWVSISAQHSIWQFGAVKFLNNGTNTVTDSTYAVQRALYAAKQAALTATHSISKLNVVLCGGGDVRISGQLVFPEGVVLDGEDKISSRLCFGWSTTTKVIGYGRLADAQLGLPLGSTFTKNWGLKNLTMAPYYPEVGPTSCTYVDYVYDIEPLLHNVRFIMHKGAVSGGQLNAVGVAFRKCIEPDFQDVTFDGGLDHLYALDATLGTTPTNGWGVVRGRMNRMYSYNARGHGLLLGERSNDNKVELTVQMPEQVGTNRAVFISGATPTNNKIELTAIGGKVKYGAIIEGERNRVHGSAVGTVHGVDVRGSRNRVDMTLPAAVTWVDTGVYSDVKFLDFAKSEGEARSVKRAVALTEVDLWVDVAVITFTPGAGHSAVLSATMSSEVTTIGRDCYDSRWLVGQGIEGVVTAREAANPFNPAQALHLRVIGSGANTAKLQASLALGTSALCDVQFSMRADRHAQIRPL